MVGGRIDRAAHVRQGDSAAVKPELPNMQSADCCVVTCTQQTMVYGQCTYMRHQHEDIKHQTNQCACTCVHSEQSQTPNNMRLDS